MLMEETIQALADYFQEMHSANLDKQENIFNAGVIDSMGFVNLIQFIVVKFEIGIEPEELIEENFYSLERMAEFILEKRQ